jgi:hypothetical protein
VKAKTGFAFTAVVLAICAALSSSPPRAVSPEWRRLQEQAVHDAVVRDLVAESGGLDDDPNMTVCVGLGLDDLDSPGPVVDAPLGLRRLLASKGLIVAPMSRCHVNKDELLVDSAGRPAVEVAAGKIEWVSPDFVKVKGYWLRGGLWALGFNYTLSLRDGTWQTDRAMRTWVS